MSKHSNDPLLQALQLLHSRKGANGPPIDYAKWSDAARRSPVAFLDTHYSDYAFRCRACGRDCVFTAEDRQHVVEVLKKDAFWSPALCDGCYAVRVGLLRERDAFAEAWRDARAPLRRAPEQLARWIEVLQLLPRYGLRPNPAKVRQLQKLLASQTPAEGD
jgi:hypothetical protein